MYGLAKTHKANIPLRPIVSTYKTHNFNLGKIVAPLISHLVNNEYTLQNSYQFSNEISKLDNSSGFHMCSFDSEAWYTNIPVSETI